MKVRLIEYDTSILDEPEKADLSEEMEIPDSMQKNDYASESDYYAAIADYISDKAGCLVKGYFMADEEE